MTIQRADVLFPVNTTTVDTAAGIDIRFLDSAQAATTDSTQSVRFLHTNDNVERTFDPANALVTVVAAATSFQGEGWALRLAQDMTPVDDINCNTILRTQTLAVQVSCLQSMNGGTGNLGGTTSYTFRASLWRYDTVANTGISIASGSTVQAWNNTSVTGDNNTRKNIVISITIPSTVEFLANEVLLLQLGVLSGTLPNPITGTTNFDITLDVDDAATFLDFADGGLIGLRQQCVLSHSLIGEGLVPASVRAVTMARTATGEGLVSFTKAASVSKTFSLIGEGLVTHTKAVGEFFDLIGEGLVSMTRVVSASKTFTLIGEGLVVPATMAVTLARTATGEGLVTFTKVANVSKTFNLIGEGLVTMTKNTQAVRTFNLIGEGVVTHQKSLALPFNVIGEGLVSFTKATIVSKIFTLIGEGLVSRGSIEIFEDFTLIGEGIVTEVHPVSAFRTFTLIGEGLIVITGANTSTITIPIDEVPTGGGGGGDIIIVNKIFSPMRMKR